MRKKEAQDLKTEYRKSANQTIYDENRFALAAASIVNMVNYACDSMDTNLIGKLILMEPLGKYNNMFSCF